MRRAPSTNENNEVLASCMKEQAWWRHKGTLYGCCLNSNSIFFGQTSHFRNQTYHYTDSKITNIYHFHPSFQKVSMLIHALSEAPSRFCIWWFGSAAVKRYVPIIHSKIIMGMYVFPSYILTDASSMADGTTGFRITSASFSVMLPKTSKDAKRLGDVSLYRRSVTACLST